MKKLFILPILLFSHLCVADISINEKTSKKYAGKMEKICKATKKTSSVEKPPSNAKFTRAHDDEKIVKKQFENKKREILNTMNELKYKKRDIANKMNELTSEIEALQDFVLTGEEKKRDFYFSVSGGKTHSSNSNAVVSGMNVITEEIATIAKTLYPYNDIEIDAVHTKINRLFEDNTIDFQWLGSAALGYHVGGNGRVEFEAIHSGMKIKKASLWAVMFNLYYDPNIKNTPIAPYIGIGVGPVNFKFASELKDNVSINLPWFAYQAKLGIAYSFIPELKISLGYRCFNIPIPIADSVIPIPVTHQPNKAHYKLA